MMVMVMVMVIVAMLIIMMVKSTSLFLTKTFSLLLVNDGDGDGNCGNADNDDGKKYLLVPDKDILSASRPVVKQLWLREGQSGSCSPSTVVSDQF